MTDKYKDLVKKLIFELISSSIDANNRYNTTFYPDRYPDNVTTLDEAIDYGAEEIEDYIEKGLYYEDDFTFKEFFDDFKNKYENALKKQKDTNSDTFEPFICHMSKFTNLEEKHEVKITNKADVDNYVYNLVYMASYILLNRIIPNMFIHTGDGSSDHFTNIMEQFIYNEIGWKPLYDYS